MRSNDEIIISNALRQLFKVITAKVENGQKEKIKTRSEQIMKEKSH